MSAWFVILAGGGGTRLWPMSRRARPKQFLELLPDGESLLGGTVARLGALAASDLANVIVVTAASQVDEVRRALPKLPAGNVIVEPMGRNTAAAIGLATDALLARDEHALLAVLPSDQFVAKRDEPRFQACLTRALDEARSGAVVTVGITPSRPETGFGYIECIDVDRRGTDDAAAVDVARFVEKPDLATAIGYLASGRFLWNAGMFFFPARRMQREIAEKLPALGEVLAQIRENPGNTDSLYATAPAISIDYAVMEKLPATTGHLRVVAGDFAWSDVGSWDALAEVSPLDAHGNATLGEVITVEAERNVVVGERLVALVGVSDLCVIATGDAVLVCPRARAQDVRLVVAELDRTRRNHYL